MCVRVVSMCGHMLRVYVTCVHVQCTVHVDNVHVGGCWTAPTVYKGAHAALGEPPKAIALALHVQ